MMSQNLALFSAPLQRDTSGKFLPGSGGRPKGAKNKINRDLLSQVKQLGPDAIIKLRDALNNGERWAVEIVLSHCLPKDRTIEFEDATPDDVREALKSGDITTSEAKDISTTLAKLAEIGDLASLKDRLADLEAAIAQR